MRSKPVTPFRMTEGKKIVDRVLVIVKPTLEEPETFSASRWLIGANGQWLYKTRQIASGSNPPEGWKE
jgi:hypothetical protein